MNNKPVAYLMVDREDGNSYIQTSIPTRDEKVSHHPYPLYTHPAELTDEEIEEVEKSCKKPLASWAWQVEFARAILRKAQET